MQEWLNTIAASAGAPGAEAVAIMALATAVTVAVCLGVAAYETGRMRERLAAEAALGRERATVETGSPTRLNELGHRMAEKMDARQWAEKTAPEVRERVSDVRPFRIAEFATRYVASELDDGLKERIAECAYEEGLNPCSINAVLAVLLRNELLRLTGQQVPAETPAPEGAAAA